VKRTVLFIIIIWAIAFTSVVPQVHAQAKKIYTLAVLDLVPNGISQVEAIGISDRLRVHISRLTRSPEYINSKGKDWYSVVERAQMDKILEQYSFQNACVSDSCAIEFGKMLQVDRIIIGTISLIGKTYSVTSRIVDVETGKTLADADRQHKGSVDTVLNDIIIQVGDELFMVKKKSYRNWYLSAGAFITGAAIYTIMSHKESGTESNNGVLLFDSPGLSDEP
jgi:hypothetical protein